MRPIKFRAWNRKYKEMFYWDELLCKKEMSCIEWANKTIHHRYVSLFQHILTSNMWDGYELMQSTWLRDKNGRDIYEWDIVANLFYEGKKSLVIERENEYWGFNISYFLQECVINKDTREVVWNIYENPELLSKK